MVEMRIDINGTKYQISKKNLDDISTKITEKSARDKFIVAADTDRTKSPNKITEAEYNAAVKLYEENLKKQVLNNAPKEAGTTEAAKNSAETPAKTEVPPGQAKLQDSKEVAEKTVPGNDVMRPDNEKVGAVNVMLPDKESTFEEFCTALKWLAIDGVHDGSAEKQVKLAEQTTDAITKLNDKRITWNAGKLVVYGTSADLVEKLLNSGNIPAEDAKEIKEVLQQSQGGEISIILVAKIRSLIKYDAFTWDNVQKLIKGEVIKLTWKNEAGEEQTADIQLDGKDKEVFTKVFRGDGWFSKGWNKVSFNTVFGDPNYSVDKIKGDKVARVNSLKEFVEMAGAVEKWNKDEKFQKFMGYSAGRKYQTYDKYFKQDDQAKMAKMGKALTEQDAPKYISGEGLDVNGDNEVNDQDFAIIFARAVLWLDEPQRNRVLKQRTDLDTQEKEYYIDYKAAEKVFGIKIEEDADKSIADAKGGVTAAGDIELGLGTGLKITKEDYAGYVNPEVGKTITLRKKVAAELLQGKIDISEELLQNSPEEIETLLIAHFNSRAKEPLQGKQIKGVDTSRVYARYLLKLMKNGYMIGQAYDDTMQSNIIDELKNKKTPDNAGSDTAWLLTLSNIGKVSYCTDEKGQQIKMAGDENVLGEHIKGDKELINYPEQGTGEKRYHIKIKKTGQAEILGYYYPERKILQNGNVLKSITVASQVLSSSKVGGRQLQLKKDEEVLIECGPELKPIITSGQVKVHNGEDVYLFSYSSIVEGKAEDNGGGKIGDKVDKGSGTKGPSIPLEDLQKMKKLTATFKESMAYTDKSTKDSAKALLDNYSKIGANYPAYVVLANLYKTYK